MPYTVVVKKDYDELSKHAARVIAERIRVQPDCVLGLATGSTPRGTYHYLIEMHRQGLDFSKVKTFNLDEYLGLGIRLDTPYAQDQSYARFMHEEFLRHINIPAKQINLPVGTVKDPEQFCLQYEEAIHKAGGIDLQLLGIGSDGHWAFNEPGSSFFSRTRVVDLAEQTIEDNYQSFFKDAGFSKDQVPRKAMTMGMATILEARELLMIASGEKKASILAKALQGPVTCKIAASAIQNYSGQATVILDEAAARGLKPSRSEDIAQSCVH